MVTTLVTAGSFYSWAPFPCCQHAICTQMQAVGVQGLLRASAKGPAPGASLGLRISFPALTAAISERLGTAREPLVHLINTC